MGKMGNFPGFPTYKNNNQIYKSLYKDKNCL